MRIQELIEQLQKQDPQREVCISQSFYDLEAFRVKEELADEDEMQLPIKDIKHEITGAVIYI